MSNAPNTQPSNANFAKHADKEMGASSAERARILLALIDKQSATAELQPLAADARKLQPGSDADTAGMPSPASLQASARDLLARLERARPSLTQKVTEAKPRFAPRAVLRSTIAALIRESTLTHEHPAVIAIVLQNQDARTQAAVLKQLPGRTARQVKRTIGTLREMA